MTTIHAKRRHDGPVRTLASVVRILGVSALLAAPVPGAPRRRAPPVRSRRLPRGRFSPAPLRSSNYQYPEWFRDAKLGMWAHWGPQAVPMFGDWYARNLYHQGHAQYKDHLEHLRPSHQSGVQGH